MLRSLVFTFLLASGAAAQPLAVEAVVDPGAELTAIGLWLSGSYSSPPDSDYKSDAWTHFAPFRDHPGLDAFHEARMFPDFTEVGLLLDPGAGARAEIAPDLSWVERYGADTLATMLDGLLAFARDSDFAAFRQRHAASREQWAREVEQSLREGGALDTLDAFFRYGDSRQRPAVRVILEPLNGWGAHAITEPSLLAEMEGDDLVVFQIGSSWDTSRFLDAPLSFARDDGSLAWHEASHVYLNSGLEANASGVAALAHLFDAENPALQLQNITTWAYAFEENLVRGVVIALTRRTQGEERAARQAGFEAQNGFVYAGRIADLIHAEYDARYADFDAFIPRVLDALASGGAETRAPEAIYDPASWDLKLFAQDSTYAAQMATSDQPIRIGAFPVREYDTPGNGNGPVSVVVEGLKLGGHFAQVGRNAETEVYFGGLAPEASGVVLVTVLVVGGEGTDAFASSRNHPVYLAEGRIAAPEARIDWLSLAVPDAPDRLVVNTRVFDLSFGRTVIVAPLADGTLRFLQVRTPAFPMDSEGMDTFGTLLAPALDTPEMRDFLQAIAPRLPDAR